MDTGWYERLFAAISIVFVDADFGFKTKTQINQCPAGPEIPV